MALLTRHVSEFREYLDCYLSVKADQARLAVHRSALQIGLAVLGGIVLAGTLVAAAVFALAGTAELLGILFGGRYWLGELVVGVSLLVAVAGGIWFFVRRRRLSEDHRIAEKYEHRKQAEREAFGTDLSARAAARNGR